MRQNEKAFQPRIRSLLGLPVRTGSHPMVGDGRTRKRNRLTPNVVPLEARQLLASFPVTSTLDTFSSPGVPTVGTLRWAVEQADAATSPSLITFNVALPATITLSNIDDTLALTNMADPTTITGPGASLLTVSGNKGSGVFQIADGVAASISGLTITKAFTNYGAIDDLGTLTLSGCTLSSNTIVAPGGGLFVGGTATVMDCTFSGNQANSGGGLYVAGSATISGCTISGNSALEHRRGPRRRWQVHLGQLSDHRQQRFLRRRRVR